MNKRDAVTVGIYAALALVFAGQAVYSNFSSGGTAGVIVYSAFSALYIGIGVIRAKKFRAAAKAVQK